MGRGRRSKKKGQGDDDEREGEGPPSVGRYSGLGPAAEVPREASGPPDAPDAADAAPDAAEDAAQDAAEDAAPDAAEDAPSPAEDTEPAEAAPEGAAPEDAKALAEVWLTPRKDSLEPVEQPAGDRAKAAVPCGQYRINLAVVAYGECHCGYPKCDHAEFQNGGAQNGGVEAPPPLPTERTPSGGDCKIC